MLQKKLSDRNICIIPFWCWRAETKHHCPLFQSFGSIAGFDGMGKSFARIPKNGLPVKNTLRLPASQNLGCD